MDCGPTFVMDLSPSIAISTDSMILRLLQIQRMACPMVRQSNISKWNTLILIFPLGTPVPSYKGPNIGTFLEPFGKYDLLEYMNK